MIVVKTYMDFEKDIYKDLDNESIITLVETYPDLQSSKMLMEEINTYKENSKQIKALKTEKLEIKKTKWIYYFGWWKNGGKMMEEYNHIKEKNQWIF